MSDVISGAVISQQRRLLQRPSQQSRAAELFAKGAAKAAPFCRAEGLGLPVKPDRMTGDQGRGRLPPVGRRSFRRSRQGGRPLFLQGPAAPLLVRVRPHRLSEVVRVRTKKKSRPKAAFRSLAIAIDLRGERHAFARGAVASEAEAGKAEHHHRPGRGFRHTREFRHTGSVH
jgi:hypothetical protein